MTKQADVCVVVGAGRRGRGGDGVTAPLVASVRVLLACIGGDETGSSTG